MYSNRMLLSSLKYFNEVLGINHLLQPVSVEENSNLPTASISVWKDSNGLLSDVSSVQCELLFISVLSPDNSDSIFSEPHWELFEKMRKAMDLENLHVKILEHVCTHESDTFHDLLNMKLNTVVIFKDTPSAREIQTTKNFKFIETYSPQYLSQFPVAKKSCWEDLQKVMKVFKSS